MLLLVSSKDEILLLDFLQLDNATRYDLETQKRYFKYIGRCSQSRENFIYFDSRENYFWLISRNVGRGAMFSCWNDHVFFFSSIFQLNTYVFFSTTIPTYIYISFNKCTPILPLIYNMCPILPLDFLQLSSGCSEPHGHGHYNRKLRLS